MNWIKFIPVNFLVKKLPEIMAYILTTVLTKLLVKYPHKTAKVKEIASDLTMAMGNLVKATSDGVITAEEINKQKALWKEVFR